MRDALGVMRDALGVMRDANVASAVVPAGAGDIDAVCLQKSHVAAGSHLETCQRLLPA
jgi:hypothetical protein